MDTPEFLSTSLHVITIFATPLHILGIYCILFQTPKAMSSVKWAMFNFHFWCMLLDWSLTILTVLFLLFPALARFPLGVLKEFGVPISYQVYLVVTLISAVAASIMLIFENRYYIMFARETRWKSYRRLFSAFNFIVSFTYFIPALVTVPDQNKGLQHVYKMLPELPEYIRNTSLFVFAIEFRWVVIPVNILLVIYMIEFYPILTLISKNMKKSIKMAIHSKNTIQMQKKFLHAVYAQSGVLLLSLQVPIVYFSFSIFCDVYIQAANNLAFVFLSLHGIACTVVMLLVHKPYREFCLRLFGWKRKRKISKAPIISIVPYNVFKNQSTGDLLLNLQLSNDFASFYSKTFMDTPEFLTTSLHGITIIATPLHILGTYCILYQTPKTMDSVKWVMLNFHCWCMILDWSLTILTIPYLLYPSMGGFPLGILKDFGIGVDYQVYFVVSVICTVIASIVLIFENRFYIMFAKNTRWEKIRKLYIPGNFVFSFTFFIPALFNVPDQEIAVRQMHILIPNMPPSISNYKLFVMATEFTWVIVPITAASLVYFTAFYILLTLSSKNLKNATKLSTHSRNTLNLQRKFMHSMHIQASVFLLNIQLPVVYGLISQYTGYFNQVYNNWSFIALSLHGVASTVVLIYVHKPYREFCSQMLGTAKRRIPRRSIVSVVIVSQT